jgi:hypothetical protein
MTSSVDSSDLSLRAIKGDRHISALPSSSHTNATSISRREQLYQ